MELPVGRRFLQILQSLAHIQDQPILLHRFVQDDPVEVLPPTSTFQCPFLILRTTPSKVLPLRPSQYLY